MPANLSLTFVIYLSNLSKVCFERTFAAHKTRFLLAYFLATIKHLSLFREYCPRRG